MSTATPQPPSTSWDFPGELYALLKHPSRGDETLSSPKASPHKEVEPTPLAILADLRNKPKKRNKLGDLTSVFAARGWKEPDIQPLSSESSDHSSTEADDSDSTPASSPPEDDSDNLLLESARKKKVTWTDELDGTPQKSRRKERRTVRIRNPKGSLVTFATEEKRWKEIHTDDEDVITVEIEDEITQSTPQVPLHLRSALLPSATYLLPSALTPSATPKELYDPGAPRILVDTNHIKPLLHLSRTEKKLRIVSRLISINGISTSLLLNNISNFMYNYGGNISSDGIHVFVDSSNITINFQEVLKKARKLSSHALVKSAPLSFHSLAMVMERFRPVAKRVLVGSSGRSDRIPDYMYQAERCGYEVSNLARVEKLKVEKDPRRSRSGAGSGYGTGSGSEGQTSLFKVSEQGVDEILHLKMAESLLDSEPSTLVVATGDAAEAEYSGGFMVMIERALNLHWKVELVAWRQGMSYAYRSKEFLQKWQGQFTIVYLDDFAEDLLAMYRHESQ